MLNETGFNKDNLKSEWKSFKCMVNQNYASIKCPLSMWQIIFTYCTSEFKNVCSLAEICLCIGASNSTVERGFSLLSNISTDKCLRISHKTMENCLLVAANTVNFTSAERDQIINDANKYLQKKCKLTLSSQQKKRCCLLSNSNDSDEEDLSNLKEATNAAAGAGDTVDLSLDEDKDKILDADESDNSDVENNNAEENQAVKDEDAKEVNKGEDAFENNEGKDKQEHDTMHVVV